LAQTINNVTRTAAMLGVSRQTIQVYINKYPELQEHRSEVLEMLCDDARSNVYEDVVYEKNVRTSIRLTAIVKNQIQQLESELERRTCENSLLAYTHLTMKSSA
jgi:hypothetical protein